MVSLFTVCARIPVFTLPPKSRSEHVLVGIQGITDLFLFFLRLIRVIIYHITSQFGIVSLFSVCAHILVLTQPPKSRLECWLAYRVPLTYSLFFLRLTIVILYFITSQFDMVSWFSVCVHIPVLMHLPNQSQILCWLAYRVQLTYSLFSETHQGHTIPHNKSVWHGELICCLCTHSGAHAIYIRLLSIFYLPQVHIVSFLQRFLKNFIDSTCYIVL